MPRSDRAASRRQRRASASMRPEGPSLSKYLWSGLGLCVAFGLKLIVVAQLKDHPLLQPDTGLDTTAYVELAKKVLAGDIGLGPGLYYVSPLYIYFLAAALWVTHSYTAVRVVQILLGVASIACMFLTADYWFGRRAAWIAAALAVATGIFTFYEALLLQASLDVFLTSAALCCLTRGLARDDPRWYGLAGVTFGIQALNRPNVILAALGVGLLLLLLRRVRPTIGLAAGLALALTPVAIRNVVVSHVWSPLSSSQGGLNFYIGNSEAATGFYHPVPGITPTIEGQQVDSRRVAEKAVGHALNDSEVSGYFSGLAWAWTRAAPGAAAWLLVRKIGDVFIAQHIALPYSYPFFAYDADTLLRYFVIGPWLLVPLGLLGLVIAAPVTRRADYLVWVSFVPTYAVAVALFFVSERYRLPMFVPLAIGAGAGVDRLVLAWRARETRRFAIAIVALAALFAAANWPRRLDDGRDDERLNMADRLAAAGRFAESEQWAALAEKTYRNKGTLHFRIGGRLLMMGQWQTAVVHLEKANQLDPGQPAFEFLLGRALIEAKRPLEAVPLIRRAIATGVPEAELPEYDLARALNLGGDDAGATETLRGIRADDQHDAEAWLRVGRLAAESHAPDVAEPFFRQAMIERPDLAAAWQQLGLNLLVLGRFDEAVHDLAEAVRLDPKDADSYSHLAYGEAKLGRATDARTYAEAALKLNPADDLARQLLAVLNRGR